MSPHGRGIIPGRQGDQAERVDGFRGDDMRAKRLETLVSIRLEDETENRGGFCVEAQPLGEKREVAGDAIGAAITMRRDHAQLTGQCIPDSLRRGKIVA
jgi:hypothetical protein